MTVGEKTSGGGQFELRVPVDQLDATLDDLSDLGEVRSMTQDEQDVTSSFESLEDQIKAAEAERKSLLTRLENADTDLEAQAIRRQLKQANRRVNSLKADQSQLAKRVSYAAVSVTLQQGKSGAGGGTAAGVRRRAGDPHRLARDLPPHRRGADPLRHRRRGDLAGGPGRPPPAPRVRTGLTSSRMRDRTPGLPRGRAFAVL